MISKEQYRNILLQQIKENEERKQVERSERLRSASPQQQDLQVVGQHKKLHIHQPDERPLVFSSMHEEYSYKPASAPQNNRAASQGRHLGIAKACEVKISNAKVSGDSNVMCEHQPDQPNNELCLSGSLNNLQKVAASPRSKVFSEAAAVPTPVKQIYQQGARNLLKLENIDQAEIDSKHRKRLEMQKMLKEQMQDIEKRRKSEREQRIAEQLREAQSNQRYVDEVQKRMLLQRKKKQDKLMRQSDVCVAAIGPPADKVSFKASEVLKVMPEQPSPRNKEKLSFKEFKAKRMMKNKADKTGVQQDENTSLNQPALVEKRQYRSEVALQQPNESTRKSAQSNRLVSQRPPTITESEFMSQSQGDSYREMQNRSSDSSSHNTARKEEYRKMQLMIARVRKDIKLQQLMFRKEIEKARREAVQAVHEKKQLEEEFNRLKEQLLGSDESMDEYYRFDVLKFNKMDSQRKDIRSEARRRPVTKNRSSATPLRPSSNEQFRSRHYRIEETVVDETCMKSLLSQSKKIPLSITPGQNEALTMSKIEEYAVDNSKLKFKEEKSQFRKKQRVRPDENSMNEFLANPYGLGGQQMENSVSQKGELIDFCLSSVDSEALNEVSGLVDREKKIVATYASQRSSRLVIRNSSFKSSRGEEDQESSDGQPTNRQYRRFRKILSVQQGSQPRQQESEMPFSPIRHQPLAGSESQTLLQQQLQ